MLRTTLRQLVSISGRTILAIGLTSATVLALAPSAKAAPLDNGEISVTSEPTYIIDFVPETQQIQLGTGVTGYTAASKVGTLTTSNNSSGGYEIKVSSAKNGFLVNTKAGLESYQAAYQVVLTQSPSDSNVTLEGQLSPSSTATKIATIKSFDLADKTFAVNIYNTNGTTAPDFTKLPSGKYADTLTFSIGSK